MAPSPEGKIDILSRVEWVVAILLSVLVLFLLVVRATHAGALWRDECDALQLARMPTLGDIVENLKFTSFPILFPMSVRMFTTLFGTSDASMRCFGLAVGAALLCIAWFNSRSVCRDVPLILPALVGLNITFLTIGTWIRGYGLGGALAVLAFGLTARFIVRPNALRLLLMFLSYLVSMQCLYFDAALVPAFLLAAFAVCLFRAQFKWALVLCGVGAICAISYVPQFQISASIKDWAVVLKSPQSFELLWQKFQTACGEPSAVMSILWLTILSLSIFAAAWRGRISWSSESATESNLLLFAAIALLLSAPTYFVFLRLLHNPPETRYYLALVCLLAAGVELIIATLRRFRWIRVARIVLVLAMASVLPFFAWPKITERETTVDLLAKGLQRYAGPNDLIIVNPWFVGMTFDWYYHGATRWMTLPELSEKRIHRFDLLKKKMEESDPMADVLSAVRQTLESGHRVWLVGGAEPSKQKFPLSLAPVPDPKFGWRGLAYTYPWSIQLGAFLQQHVVEGEVVLPPAKGVSIKENIPLLIARGWRE